MHTFDVITWEGTLSDGSTCYSAWCSYVLGVWGQGETEDAALADITSVMTDVILHPWDDGKSLADPEAASAEMAEIMADLVAEGITYKVRKVSISSEMPANV